MNPRVLVTLNTTALVVVLAVNYLANALPINGMSTGEISSRFPNYFVPAGFTFAIWGVIYILMIVFVIRTLWFFRQKDEQALDEIRNISFWFIVSCIANIIWLLAWHHLMIFTSLMTMIVLLYSLMKIYQRIHEKSSQLFSHLLFSTYLGWISVATIANFTVYLLDSGWNDQFLKPEVWSALMIVVASILSIYFIFRLNDRVFPLVIIWAVFGIYINVSNPGYEMFSGLVSITAIIVLLMLSVLWLVSVWRQYQKPKTIQS